MAVCLPQELSEGVETDAPAAKNLWSTVIAPVNEQMPAHGCVVETHVIALPSGSFVRTPKGSVNRKATAAKFADKIDHVYEACGDCFQSGSKRTGSILHHVSIEISPDE